MKNGEGPKGREEKDKGTAAGADTVTKEVMMKSQFIYPSNKFKSAAPLSNLSFAPA
jgi:hypothetical protein